MIHSEGHPCEHANLQCDGASKDAVAAQIVRLDNLKCQLGQLPADSPEAQSVRREAIKIVNQLYESLKGSFCSCRIPGWYYRTSAEWGAPLSWTPM